ncbi:hypothetical protein KKF82_07880 [Patescibacteria group bacterium]|uniref:Uncharacterized protein n=2 Tax=viral metagenome TaxID=1070528 RepID=A0A6M3M8A5_9ZZZZ|nr:hypothetical protein [Patescibacteria group bacterium]
MADWTKVGVSVAVGGGGGAIDQVVQNADVKREEEKGEKLGIMSQYGTYYNYGVPILAILGATFGFLRGDMATRLITMGSTLAGRKVTWQITKRGEAASPWMRGNPDGNRQRLLAEKKARDRARAQIDAGNERTIAVVSEQEMLV